ncbi:NYN domain-containing protein [Streptomyces sp. NBC_00654]|uniref:NYN domain-containing protein n=1 Tax=Streptomyces sp. NBC_00654 TaxID=2975799 RepID=UPI00224CE01F|nr:NYN domain-containing protein [Streptomyces sp. NBC_00654]MCX4970823.1 NYN domain-containing protein [Streptomyces sp. NBC_00654]
MSELIVYVDGFNLYHGLHAKYGRRFLWLDLEKLARTLRPRDQLVKVKYFTASVMNDPGALSRQDAYLQALPAHSGDTVEIIKGRYQAKQKTCRQCGSNWTHYEEKETDVNIAVSLAADVATKSATSAVIISADSDLAPAVRKAKSLAPGTHIMAAFPPKRYSNELKTLMPASFLIGRAKFSGAQLPDQVVDPATGHVIERPAKWA